ncbi:hypothetical protein MUP77_01340 [Candidatus Bathyarchaeota archaeon]|nr:hypothetical protein [Candidatus Bathyarchaeota archaeon]
MYADLKEFILHTDRGRLEMAGVTVVKYGESLNLVGRVVKSEAVASTENPNIVFKSKIKQDRFNVVRLRRTEEGQIRAYEGYDCLGKVIWDKNTGALKLPCFMRKLLEVP